MSEVKVELGIKESKEAFKALQILALTAGKVVKDGKVGVDDFTHLIPLFLEFDKVSEGVKDINLALAELKNLSQAELVELVSEAYGIFAKFQEGKNS